MYLNTTTGQFPLYAGDIMLAQRNWKIGDPLPDGWVEIAPIPLPAMTESQVPVPGVQQVDGVWTMTWTLRTLTAAEIAARRVADARMKVMRGDILTQEEALLLTR